MPDIYQGSELWNYSLVDPDNRRPVDFDLRQRLLAGLESANLREVLDNWTDGRAKLLTLTRALRFRRDHADLLTSGDYEPLSTDDDAHLIAFGRRFEAQELVVIVPRFLAVMMRGMPLSPLGMDRWRTMSIRLPRRLARSRLVNVFTGEITEPLVHRGTPWLLAGAAFQSWPVAMLHTTV